MKKLIAIGPNRRAAFTLIELLVVIAVIGMLAGMILAVTRGIYTKKNITLATAEMNQVATAIEAYKAKFGSYPPGNPNSVHFNPLYFELVGTVFEVRSGVGGYKTIDGSFWISTNTTRTVLGVNGFVNSATSARGDDERPAPKNFLPELKLNQIATNNAARILACSVGWDGNAHPVYDFCSWRYNSKNPSNNSGTFDLWVDLYIQKTNNRVCNWSRKPLIVPIVP